MQIKMEKPVDKVQRRSFDELVWVDPKQVLINFRHMEMNLPKDLDQKIRRMRTNKLKNWREARDAALFTYGMGNKVLDTMALVAKSEKSDYDFIMKWIKDNKEYYCPVQLKELPPDDINPNVQINDIFKKLNKYRGIDNLLVAIKINREIKSFDLDTYNLEQKHKIKELWYFGCVQLDQSK